VTSGTSAQVSAKDQAELISVARNFFILAVLVVAVAVPLIYHYQGRENRILIWSIGFAGLVGWASASIVSKRANLSSSDIGLTERFVENWGVLAVFVAFMALYSTTM
jgi:hypothetical protein